MNVKKNDQKKKKKIAPFICTIGIILYMLGIVILFLYLNAIEPAPLGIFLFIGIIPIAVMIGILLALKERRKEIEGGEEDAARKY